MRIATIPDPQGAGLLVSQAAIRRGHTVVLDSPDVAYIRTLNYGPWKTICLERIASYHHRGIPTLPTYADSLLYDDKAAQAAVLQKWLPKTHVITRAAHVPMMRVPFISKSAHGSGSHNVRLISTHAEADAEVKAAFEGAGIPTGRGKRQRGYLIWQAFIPGNSHDIRVVICGENAFGLRRFNREHVPFASGSGKLQPITKVIYPDSPNMHSPGDAMHLRRSFELAHEISEAIGTRWACYDFVHHWERGITYVLEVSFSWTEPAYAQCPCFDRVTLEPNGRAASEWGEFAVDEMERLLR